MSFKACGDNQMIKGIIFDIDGTLLDSMGLWATIGDEYLKSKGYKLGAVSSGDACREMSLPEACSYLAEEYKTAESPEEIFEGIKFLIREYYHLRLPLKDGAAEFLRLMKSRGIKLCAATSTDADLIEPALARCGVLDLFEGVLTCACVGKPKTDPEIYRKALELLGTAKEDTLVFEDAFFCARTAAADGFRVAGIYDPDEPNPEGLKAIGSYYFKDYKEALAAFNRCVVIAGADINNPDRVKKEIRKEDFVIYCDCGLRHREALGIEPDLIVGDFDSYENPGLSDIETIVLPSEKDDTDSMYAIKEAAGRGYREFLLAGAIGARLDHSLVNVYALVTLDSMGLKGSIIDDYSIMELAGKEPSYVEGSYSYFSLINICGVARGISIKNAKYPLEKAEITQQFQFGTSNEVLPGCTAEITVEEGKMLLIKDF